MIKLLMHPSNAAGFKEKRYWWKNTNSVKLRSIHFWPLSVGRYHWLMKLIPHAFWGSTFIFCQGLPADLKQRFHKTTLRSTFGKETYFIPFDWAEYSLLFLFFNFHRVQLYRSLSSHAVIQFTFSFESSQWALISQLIFILMFESHMFMLSCWELMEEGKRPQKKKKMWKSKDLSHTEIFID